MTVFVAAVTVVKSATNATFLAHRPAEQLPFLYLGSAVLVTAVALSLGQRLGRGSARMLLRRGSIAGSIGIIALTFLVVARVPGANGALYVAGDAYASGLSILFWARLAELFDPRAAKRVFGLIGAAGMAGAVLGGTLVSLLSSSVPALAWCVLGPAALVASSGLVGSHASAPARRAPRLGKAVTRVVRQPYPRGLAAVVLLLAVQTAAVDYAFRRGAIDAFGADEARLAGLFGQLNMWVGLATVAFQLLLTKRLIERLGVFVFASLVPLLACAIAGWALLTPGAFVPLFALKAVEMAASLSLQQPVLQLLYTPIPAVERPPVRAIVDGAVKKMGGAVGGVLLLVVGLERPTSLGLVAGIAVVSVVALRGLRVLYRRTLATRLAGEGRRPVLDPSDRATRQALLSGLNDPDPEKVKAVLSVLARSRRPLLLARVAELLESPDPGVREHALGLVLASPSGAWASPLAARLERRSAAELGAAGVEAARAFLASDPSRAQVWLRDVLDDPQADLRMVAVALEAHAEHPAAARWQEGLRGRLEQASPDERRELIAVLGPTAPLEQLLDDPELGVRRAAHAAAGRSGSAQWIPRLMAALDHVEERESAAAALVALGDLAVPGLSLALDDRRLPVVSRKRVPPLLRRIGTPLAGAALLDSNVRDDASLRFVIVRAVARLRREHPDIVFDRESAEQAALRRLKAWRYYQRLGTSLSEASGASMLLRGLAERATELAKRLRGARLGPRPGRVREGSPDRARRRSGLGRARAGGRGPRGLDRPSRGRTAARARRAGAPRRRRGRDADHLGRA